MAALKNKASTLQQVSADLAERAGGLMRLDAQWSWGGGEQMKGGMQESRILGIQKWWANLEHKNCTTSLGTGTHPTGDLFVLMILGHGVQLVGIDLDLM